MIPEREFINQWQYNLNDWIYNNLDQTEITDQLGYQTNAEVIGDLMLAGQRLEDYRRSVKEDLDDIDDPAPLYEVDPIDGLAYIVRRQHSTKYPPVETPDKAVPPDPVDPPGTVASNAPAKAAEKDLPVQDKANL